MTVAADDLWEQQLSSSKVGGSLEAVEDVLCPPDRRGD